jgi:uncharacterized damage-inducible protein DinB
MSEHSEILERFRRGAELLAMATTGAAGSELDFAAEGKWSVRQIACHVADAEVVWVIRFRQVIAEDNPTLPVFDRNAWAEKLDYSRRKISVALEQFRVMRSENFELLKELPDATFARTGTHTKRGAMTLLEMVTLAAEHLEKHVTQIRTTRAAFKEHKAQQKAAS